MVIRVKEVISIHVLNYLKENCPLNDFAEDAEYCHRSVILCQKRIIFFKERDNLCYLVLGRKYSLLDGQVHNVSDSWKNIFNYEFDGVSVNSINSTRLAVF